MCAAGEKEKEALFIPATAAMCCRFVTMFLTFEKVNYACDVDHWIRFPYFNCVCVAHCDFRHCHCCCFYYVLVEFSTHAKCCRMPIANQQILFKLDFCVWFVSYEENEAPRNIIIIYIGRMYAQSLRINCSNRFLTRFPFFCRNRNAICHHLKRFRMQSKVFRKNSIGPRRSYLLVSTNIYSI